MTLTEQWKKGKLDRGIYYIKEQGSYKTDEWHGNCWGDSWSENIEEVLAPVPCYEEWQSLNKALDNTVDANLNQATWMVEMEKENQQLKELLKECREEISDEIDDCTDPRIELFAKIDEVLK